MPVTKSDLINETAISCGIAREDAKVAIEQFFDVVKTAVKDGDSIEIRGFGTFSQKSCNPRNGRNLKTGELIPLAACKSMSFKFSQELKAKILGSQVKAIKATANKQVHIRETAKMNSL